MSKKKPKRARQTGSIGANKDTNIGGNVNTGGGDFVGRDKLVLADRGGVAIGGSSLNDVITTGSGNRVVQAQRVFAPVYRAIERSDRTERKKSDLSSDVGAIEAEVSKGDQADRSFIASRLRNLRNMAPDIADVALAALSGPGGVFGALVRKVAEKIKAETQSASQGP